MSEIAGDAIANLRMRILILAFAQNALEDPIALAERIERFVIDGAPDNPTGLGPDQIDPIG